jgi:hypothetical protein
VSHPKGSTWWIVSCDAYYRCDAGHTETQRPRRHPVQSCHRALGSPAPSAEPGSGALGDARHRTEHLRGLSAVACRLLKLKRDFGSACAINWENHREDENRQMQACKTGSDTEVPRDFWSYKFLRHVSAAPSRGPCPTSRGDRPEAQDRWPNGQKFNNKSTVACCRTTNRLLGPPSLLFAQQTNRTRRAIGLAVVYVQGATNATLGGSPTHDQRVER